MSEQRVTVFEPSSKPMKAEYPELAKIPEFESLSNAQLVFVWHYASPTSDLSKLKDDRRALMIALERSKLVDNLPPEDYNRYMQHGYPDSIRVAIQKMKGFNPSIRMKAKLMHEKIFSTYNTFIDEGADREGGAAAKKAYVDMSSKISGEMPSLIEKLEEAYGIKVKKTKGEKETKFKPMDNILNED